MPEEFVCNCCGKCCTEFGLVNRTSECDGPLYDFEINAPRGLVLFEFEIERLVQELPSLKIQPYQVLIDILEKQRIIFDYNLIQQPCPFLKDGKCSIYEKRPLICRAFPLFVGSGNKIIENISCPKIIFRDIPVGSPLITKNVKKAYNEQYLNALKIYYLTEIYINCINKLMMSNKAIFLRYDTQLSADKLSKDWKVISFSNFLKTKNIFTNNFELKANELALEFYNKI